MLLQLLFLVFAAWSADEYVVVGVSGRGTNGTQYSKPSRMHTELPLKTSVTSHVYKAYHFHKLSDFEDVFAKFECEGGVQKNNLKFVVAANSWGSALGVQLAQEYKKRCGRNVEVFFLADGVKKPVSPLSAEIPANKCFNWYHTKAPFRGRQQADCVNVDITPKCVEKNYNSAQCHRMAQLVTGEAMKKFFNSLGVQTVDSLESEDTVVSN